MIAYANVWTRWLEQKLVSLSPYRLMVMYRLHISLLFLAMLLVHFSAEAEVSGYGPLIGFSCWHLALYVFNRYTDRAEDGCNAPVEATTGLHARIALWLTGVLLCLGAWVIWLSDKTLAFYLGSLPLVFLYGLKIPGMARRIKDVPFLKNGYAVLCCWCIPVILVSATYQGKLQVSGELTGFLLLLVFFTACYEILADIKDVRGDAESGVETLPVRYGVGVARGGVVLLILVAWLTSFWVYPFFSYPFALLILVFLAFIGPDEPPLYFHGLILATFLAVMLYYSLYVLPSLSSFFL